MLMLRAKMSFISSDSYQSSIVPYYTTTLRCSTTVEYYRASFFVTPEKFAL